MDPALDCVPEAICLLDNSGFILAGNKRFAKSIVTFQQKDGSTPLQFVSNFIGTEDRFVFVNLDTLCRPHSSSSKYVKKLPAFLARPSSMHFTVNGEFISTYLVCGTLRYRGPLLAAAVITSGRVGSHAHVSPRRHLPPTAGLVSKSP